MRSHQLFALLVLVLLCGSAGLAPHAVATTAAAPDAWTVWLPLISANAACNESPDEAALADLMRNDPGQQRPSLTCHPLLEAVARAHARDMADHDFFAHVSPITQLGPDERVRRAGYGLPSWYGTGTTTNTIESITMNKMRAEYVWRALLGSPGHNSHVLGKNEVFAQQIFYGIGVVIDYSQLDFYWVIVTAPPPGANVPQP